MNTIAKRIFLTIFALLIFVETKPLSASEEQAIYKACEIISQATNKTTPRRVDSLTVLTSTACTKSSGRVIFVLFYQMDLIGPEAVFSAQEIELMRTRMSNTWCTDKSMSALLKAMNIRFVYSDQDSRQRARFDISNRNCGVD
jgi:hypothetical protein